MTGKKKKGIKSALELAMEKIDGGGAPAALSDEQKEKIAEIERTAAAGIAELEIMTAQRLSEAIAAGDVEGASRMEEEQKSRAARIREKAEREKEDVRGRGAGVP